MKKILLLLFLVSTLQTNILPADKARGVFVAFGVGPRLPISYFANSTDLGYGFNIELSYTDNEYLPFFIFAKVGFEQYPGSLDYYQSTDHSNLSTNILPVNMGIRYYFPPFLENIFLLIPIVEASAAFNYYNRLHEFKPGSGRSNYIEENSKLGVSVGAGVSMFMMEILATYNYFETSQNVAVDLKVRLPLYVIF
ncbi:MAG: hypothetical protein R6W90_10585 [Ignavibacteriaceae bacterium]